LERQARLESAFATSRKACVLGPRDAHDGVAGPNATNLLDDASIGRSGTSNATRLVRTWRCSVHALVLSAQALGARETDGGGHWRDFYRHIQSARIGEGARLGHDPRAARREHRGWQAAAQREPGSTPQSRVRVV